MILVDTSVWIDHINATDPMLTALLAEERVLAHPYVIGEISLGSLRDRDIVLGALLDLPRAPVATPEETLPAASRSIRRSLMHLLSVSTWVKHTTKTVPTASQFLDKFSRIASIRNTPIRIPTTGGFPKH